LAAGLLCFVFFGAADLDEAFFAAVVAFFATVFLAAVFTEAAVWAAVFVLTALPATFLAVFFAFLAGFFVGALAINVLRDTRQ
jgi:hypothetical protein